MGPTVGSIAAGGRVAPPHVCLLCRVGSQRYALPIAHAVETMRPLPVEVVAGAPAGVLGLAVIRGAPTPVVDLAVVVGVADAAPPSRFVVVTVGGRRAALAVAEVLGVYPLDAATFEGLPPLLRGAAAGAVAAVGALDGEVLSLIDGARVVPEAAWDALKAAER